MPIFYRFDTSGPIRLGKSNVLTEPNIYVPGVHGGSEQPSILVSVYNRNGTYVQNTDINEAIPLTIGVGNSVNFSKYYQTSNWNPTDFPNIPDPGAQLVAPIPNIRNPFPIPEPPEDRAILPTFLAPGSPNADIGDQFEIIGGASVINTTSTLNYDSILIGDNPVNFTVGPNNSVTVEVLRTHPVVNNFQDVTVTVSLTPQPEEPVSGLTRTFTNVFARNPINLSSEIQPVLNTTLIPGSSLEIEGILNLPVNYQVYFSSSTTSNPIFAQSFNERVSVNSNNKTVFSIGVAVPNELQLDTEYRLYIRNSDSPNDLDFVSVANTNTPVLFTITQNTQRRPIVSRGVPPTLAWNTEASTLISEILTFTVSNDFAARASVITPNELPYTFISAGSGVSFSTLDVPGLSPTFPNLDAIKAGGDTSSNNLLQYDNRLFAQAYYGSQATSLLIADQQLIPTTARNFNWTNNSSFTNTIYDFDYWQWYTDTTGVNQNSSWTSAPLGYNTYTQTSRIGYLYLKQDDIYVSCNSSSNNIQNSQCRQVDANYRGRRVIELDDFVIVVDQQNNGSQYVYDDPRGRIVIFEKSDQTTFSNAATLIDEPSVTSSQFAFAGDITSFFPSFNGDLDHIGAISMWEFCVDNTSADLSMDGIGAFGRVTSVNYDATLDRTILTTDGLNTTYRDRLKTDITEPDGLSHTFFFRSYLRGLFRSEDGTASTLNTRLLGVYNFNNVDLVLMMRENAGSLELGVYDLTNRNFVGWQLIPTNSIRLDVDSAAKRTTFLGERNGLLWLAIPSDMELSVGYLNIIAIDSSYTVTNPIPNQGEEFQSWAITSDNLLVLARTFDNPYVDGLLIYDADGNADARTADIITAIENTNDDLSSPTSWGLQTPRGRLGFYETSNALNIITYNRSTIDPGDGGFYLFDLSLSNNTQNSPTTYTFTRPADTNKGYSEINNIINFNGDPVDPVFDASIKLSNDVLAVWNSLSTTSASLVTSGFNPDNSYTFTINTNVNASGTSSTNLVAGSGGASPISGSISFTSQAGMEVINDRVQLNSNTGILGFASPSVGLVGNEQYDFTGNTFAGTPPIILNSSFTGRISGIELFTYTRFYRSGSLYLGQTSSEVIDLSTATSLGNRIYAEGLDAPSEAFWEAGNFRGRPINLTPTEIVYLGTINSVEWYAFNANGVYYVGFNPAVVNPNFVAIVGPDTNAITGGILTGGAATSTNSFRDLLFTSGSYLNMTQLDGFLTPYIDATNDFNNTWIAIPSSASASEFVFDYGSLAYYGIPGSGAVGLPFPPALVPNTGTVLAATRDFSSFDYIINPNSLNESNTAALPDVSRFLLNRVGTNGNNRVVVSTVDYLNEVTVG